MESSSGERQGRELVAVRPEERRSTLVEEEASGEASWRREQMPVLKGPRVSER